MNLFYCYTTPGIAHVLRVIVAEANRVGNLLSSLEWAIENQLRKVFPDLKDLDLSAIAKEKAPGMYTLFDRQDRRAYLTLDESGEAKVWDLEYDPEYLGRATDLSHKGTIIIYVNGFF